MPGWYPGLQLDFIRSNLAGMPIDLVEAEPRSSFAGETLDDFCVSWTRCGRTSNPVVDRGGADVECKREGFNAVGLNEAREFRFPTSPHPPMHRLPLYLCGNSTVCGKIGARGLQIPEPLTQHSEATAVRDGSNLSNSCKKSSPLILKSNHPAVLNLKCVITQRELADLVPVRPELRQDGEPSQSGVLAD
jgi:hypothetical protein